MVHIERMMFDEHAAEIIHSNAAMSDRSNPGMIDRARSAALNLNALAELPPRSGSILKGGNRGSSTHNFYPAGRRFPRDRTGDCCRVPDHGGASAMVGRGERLWEQFCHLCRESSLTTWLPASPVSPCFQRFEPLDYGLEGRSAAHTRA